MSGNYLVKFDEPEQHRKFFQRALLPYSKRHTDNGGSQRKLAEYVGQSRSWIKDNINMPDRAVAIEPFPELIDHVTRSEPIYLANNLDAYVEEVQGVKGCEDGRVAVPEEVYVPVLEMFELDELSDMTGFNKTTLKQHRKGDLETLPAELWNNFSEAASRRLRELEEPDYRVHIVDKNLYCYGHRTISESTVEENLTLEELEEFIESLQ